MQSSASHNSPAARLRHLQPYQAKNFKELLRLADVHGPDHLTPVGATLLMQALLAKGADPARRDDFGHTAWDHAVGRAMQEAGFARSGLPALFELLAPAALDVQTDGRLVRLERHQGEYWILTLMLAGLKTQWSRCVLRKLALYKYPTGFFADQLHDVLAELPAWLWPDKRRKRSYLNQVLARAEMHSTYQPARRLWGRARYGGYYVPNPTMQLRVGEAWQPLREVLALDWIDRGCGRDGGFTLRPRELLDRLEARANDDRDGDASAG